ncbi:MAG: helix-turn-helix domain-containing protein, partial [Patescibacteria group bacterium]
MANKVGVSPDTVEALCREGKIASQSIGGRWYISEEAIPSLAAHAGLDVPAAVSSVVSQVPVQAAVVASGISLKAAAASLVLVVAGVSAVTSFGQGILSQGVSALSSLVFPKEASVAAVGATTQSAAAQADTGVTIQKEELQKFEAKGFIVAAPLYAQAAPSKAAPVTEKIIYEQRVISVPAPAFTVASQTGDLITRAEFDLRIKELSERIALQYYSLQDTFSTSQRASSGFGYQTLPSPVSQIALTQKIDQLTGVSLSDVRVDGITGLTDEDIPDQITLTSSGPLSAASASFTGSLSAGVLSISTTTATSTFASGIDIASGCFAISGVCVSSGSGSGNVSGSGSVSQLTFWTGASMLSGNDTLVWDTSNFRLGLGTTSPGTRLGVTGDAVIAGTTTVGQLTSTSTLLVSGTATSTFSGGIVSAGLSTSQGVTITGGSLNIEVAATSTSNNGFNIVNGCYAWRGICISGSGGGGTIIGGGTLGQVSFFDGMQSIASDSTFLFDSSLDLLTILNASSTRFSAISYIKVGGTATSTISGNNGLSTLSSDLLVTGSTTLQNVTALSATTTNATTTSLAITGGFQVTSLGTSTFTGGLSTAGVASSQGVTISGGNLLISSVATSSLAGGLSTAGLSSSQGLVISGGNILSTSAATSTFANGLNISAGCFATSLGCVGQAAGTVLDAALSANVALLNRTSQIFTGDNTFNAAGTALTVSNTAAIGTLTITGSATSTSVGGFITSAGYDGKFATLQQILLGSGSATSSITGGATSTFSGGAAASGLSSSNGITLSGGIITQSNTATNTLSSISAAGLAASNGLTLTGGRLRITSTATSSLANGISLSAGCFATSLGCVGQAAGTVQDAALSSNVALLDRSSQSFTGTNTFTNNVTFGKELTLTGTGTSTSVGGFSTVKGYDGKFATLQQILLGSGSATSSITGGATSTFSGGIAGAGISSSNGLTLTGGKFAITGSATSTANNGFNLSAGCFAVNDVCVGSGAGTITGSGTSGQITFWSGASAITGDLSFVWDNTTKFFGLGTSTPSGRLSVANNPGATTPAFIISTTTAANATSTAFIVDSNGKVGIGTSSPSAQLAIAGNIYAAGTATNTFAGGINITSGCLAINGTCFASGNKYFAAYATSSHGGTTTIVFSGTAGSQPSFDASTDTLTLPSDTAQIEVEVWGGGGGGGGDAVNGTTGGQTCLSTNAADACASPLASATGGGGGLSTGSVTGGTPGTGVTGDLILSGSAGNSGYYFHDTGNAWGGTGGAAPRGGGGGRGGQQALNGGDGYPYGGGGGGSGTDVVGNTGASGGGGGGYAQKIIAPPASAYYFTLGVGGAGAVATPAGGKAGAGGFNVKVFTSTAGTGVAGGWIDDGTVVRLQTSADKVAIGTSTPYAGLTVWGQDTASTTKLFEFTNNASTTLFSLTNAGTATFGVANNAANFGIGATSTPFARLSIAGQANHNIALFAVSKSTASATSTAFLIDSNGRIGVGTTTASDLALGFADNFGFLGLPKFTTAQRGGLIGNSTSTGSVIFNTTTGRPEFFDGANWIGITATSGPTFSADNSANITFTANGGTGAANVTPYDTVNFDTNNNFTKCTSNCTGTGPTPAISKFTPTVAGKYIFTASFIFQSP